MKSKSSLLVLLVAALVLIATALSIQITNFNLYKDVWKYVLGGFGLLFFILFCCLYTNFRQENIARKNERELSSRRSSIREVVDITLGRSHIQSQISPSLVQPTDEFIDFSIEECPISVCIWEDLSVTVFGPDYLLLEFDRELYRRGLEWQLLPLKQKQYVKL